MKKKKIFGVTGLIVFMTIVISTGNLFGQEKYFTNGGHVKFFSHTAIEDITADNNDVASVIDTENGKVAIIITMTKFQFEKKLMQEHFNENYVESEKYPKAIFNGRIVNNSEVDYSSKGSYPVQVEGEMKIHGVQNEIIVEGSIEVTEDGIIARTVFPLNPEDYDIKIPKVVRKNISEKLEISAVILHKPV